MPLHLHKELNKQNNIIAQNKKRLFLSVQTKIVTLNRRQLGCKG